MKAVLFVFANLLLLLNAAAQGSVIWSPPTLPITTNGLGNSGPISGTNTYRFGLYIGPAGSDASSLSLVAMAWNDPLVPGRIAGGGGPVILPGPFTNGTTITFQLRGWSAFAGPTYEEAFAYALAGNQPLAFLGQSTLGSYVIGSPLPLRTEPFVLIPIPEPASWALGGLGLLIFATTRLKRSPR